jgi:predicted RNA polymerase sigma factor
VAGIAALHATAPSVEETRWDEIVTAYDLLMRIRPSPVVALSRAIAVAQHEGPARGLEAIAAIDDTARLAAYPFYPAAKGELELRLGHTAAARDHFQAAQRLARNEGERRFLAGRIAACDRVV